MNNTHKKSSEIEVERFARWQSITIQQLTYSVNLILGFAVATLGFQTALLINEKFVPVLYQKCAFGMSMLLLVASISLGIFCVINRLRDFRATKEVARMEMDGESGEKIQTHRDLYAKLGKRTWEIFWWQIGTFSASILLLLFGISSLIIHKLV